MAAMNAAFHNIKWEEEMETKGVNVRWKYFKLENEEEVKKMKKPNPKAPWQTKRVCRWVKKQIQLWKRYEKTGRNKEYEEYEAKK